MIPAAVSDFHFHNVVPYRRRRGGGLSQGKQSLRDPIVLLNLGSKVENAIPVVVVEAERATSNLTGQCGTRQYLDSFCKESFKCRISVFLCSRIYLTIHLYALLFEFDT